MIEPAAQPRHLFMVREFHLADLFTMPDDQQDPADSKTVTAQGAEV
jgi:hypothetical protein